MKRISGRFVRAMILKSFYIHLGSNEIHCVLVILLEYIFVIYLSDFVGKNAAMKIRMSGKLGFKFLFISQEIKIHLYIPS